MKASEVVHDHPDGGYFVGKWSEFHAQWQRPLDAETKRLSGCHTEFQRGRFSPQASLKGALRLARSLYGDIEDDMSCNGGQTDMPCPAALEKLGRVTSRELATWRGTVSCDVCGGRWRGDSLWIWCHGPKWRAWAIAYARWLLAQREAGQ